MINNKPNEIELEVNIMGKVVHVRIVSFDKTTDEIIKSAEKTTRKMLKLNKEDIRMEVG